MPTARGPRGPYQHTTTAEERRDLARAAANARWAKVADRTAEMRAAREGRNAQYYAEADRQGITDPAVREAMARNAERAEMARMRAAKARRARLARQAAADADTPDGLAAG